MSQIIACTKLLIYSKRSHGTSLTHFCWPNTSLLLHWVYYNHLIHWTECIGISHVSYVHMYIHAVTLDSTVYVKGYIPSTYIYALHMYICMYVVFELFTAICLFYWLVHYTVHVRTLELFSVANSWIRTIRALLQSIV